MLPMAANSFLIRPRIMPIQSNMETPGTFTLDFGPVSYTLEAVAETLVQGTVVVPPRQTARDLLTIRVRVPAGKISRVTVNGKAHTNFDVSTGTINLTGYADQVTLGVHLEP